MDNTDSYDNFDSFIDLAEPPPSLVTLYTSPEMEVHVDQREFLKMLGFDVENHDFYICKLEEESLEEYKLKWNGKLPSVLFNKNQYYSISTSSKSADFIEQMFYSYVTAGFDDCLEIGEAHQQKLEDDPKEKARILSYYNIKRKEFLLYNYI